MDDSRQYTLLFETELDIDDERLAEGQRSAEVIVSDDDLSLLKRPSRVALGLGQATRMGPAPGNPGTSCFDIPLQCVLHPAAGCLFRTARLVVDLRETGGALVRDISPRDVRDDEPVEVTTTVSAGLKFDVAPSPVSGELKRERSVTRTLHHPRVIASGTGTARAVWSFTSVRGDYLQPQRELRLLASVPAASGLQARFNFLAQVTLGRAGAVIPLLRRRAEIDQTYWLA